MAGLPETPRPIINGIITAKEGKDVGSMRGSMRRVARTDVTDQVGAFKFTGGGEGECDVKRTLQ